MGRTIIQPIGPLYGEAVNGTVFGRPNGSVYVPQSNTITLSLPTVYIRNGVGNPKLVYPCNAAGNIQYSGWKIIAESQDSAAYMSIEIATDSEFTSIVSTANFAAGTFNTTQNYVVFPADVSIEDEATYYIRAVLNASTAVPVAVSTAITVTGVVPA